jgi:hydrogenase maturation protein HypF
VTRRIGPVVLANEVEVQLPAPESDVRERSPILPADRRIVRWRCAVSGRVQGVGFRPYVCGLARSLGVTGFVGNDAAGVFVEVQGAAAAVTAFADRMRDCPAPAQVGAVRVEELPPRPDAEFVIAASAEGGAGAILPSDCAPCADCLRDFFSPGDRRFGYPFLTCARCGPRFTLIRDLPFDRERTAMDAFRVCPACAGGYRDPDDRRFHAQTLACPARPARVVRASSG